MDVYHNNCTLENKSGSSNKSMMKTAFCHFTQAFIFLFFVMTDSTAQQNKTDITGVYLLTGVMETASVFELKPDSSFEFFFSQGALDRGGKGKWTLKDGNIIFNSTDKRPPKDYALVSSKSVPGNLQENTNSQGEIQFPKKNATGISLLFRLCPDRESIFTVNKDHNYFEFKLEPWIAEVFFQNFSLQLGDKGLNGRHPLLEGNEFRYKKE
jgi:hypothetical protein